MRAHLLLSTAFAALTTITTTAAMESEHEKSLQTRAFFEDEYKIYIRKRNAHACMMSIVFIVLFPLAAISLHLPLKGVRVVTRIHVPIQILGLAMMIGAMGLGIDIARNDLNYFSPVKTHVVVGLLATSTIIVLQPALGLLQHRYFKKTGQKSVYAHVHRWVGRVAICLGWINSGLGFQLVGMELISTSTLVREYVFLGVLGGLWLLLMGFDGFRSHISKKQRLSSYALGWKNGLRLNGDKGEADGMNGPKTDGA